MEQVIETEKVLKKQKVIKITSKTLVYAFLIIVAFG